MTDRRGVWIPASLAALLALSGCAEPPGAALTRARTAVSGLRDLERADIWAAEDLASAEEALKEAEREIARQSERFSWMRRYSRAEELLAAAIEDAELARAAAEQGRQQAETDAREALEAASAAVGHARASMMVAPLARARGGQVGRVQDDLAKAESGLDEIDGMIRAGKYREAEEEADRMLERISTVMAAVGRATRP